MRKMLNYLFRGLFGLFAAITILVAAGPYAITMLFAYLDELTDK